MMTYADLHMDSTQTLSSVGIDMGYELIVNQVNIYQGEYFALFGVKRISIDCIKI